MYLAYITAHDTTIFDRAQEPVFRPFDVEFEEINRADSLLFHERIERARLDRYDFLSRRARLQGRCDAACRVYVEIYRSIDIRESALVHRSIRERREVPPQDGAYARVRFHCVEPYARISHAEVHASDADIRADIHDRAYVRDVRYGIFSADEHFFERGEAGPVVHPDAEWPPLEREVEPHWRAQSARQARHENDQYHSEP